MNERLSEEDDDDDDCDDESIPFLVREMLSIVEQNNALIHAVTCSKSRKQIAFHSSRVSTLVIPVIQELHDLATVADCRNPSWQFFWVFMHQRKEVIVELGRFLNFEDSIPPQILSPTERRDGLEVEDAGHQAAGDRDRGVRKNHPAMDC